MPSRSSVTARKVMSKGFQIFFRSNMKVTIFLYVVSRYTFLEEIVNNSRFSNLQPIDLNVAE